MVHKTNGSSTLNLIITIIVIIIIATIAIYASLDTPEKTIFAKFVSEFSDMHMAINHECYIRQQQYSLEQKSRSEAQIYYMIAKNKDIDDINITPSGDINLSSLGITVLPEAINGSQCYEIEDDKTITDWNKNIGYYQARELEHHYITDKGDVFFLPGYLIKENGKQKWYINENKYYVGEKVTYADEPISSGDLKYNVSLIHVSSPIVLVKGGFTTISAQITPSSIIAKIAWESNNKSIATVQNGTIHAISSGETIITCYAQINHSKKDTCIIKVVEPSIITFSKNNLSKINIKNIPLGTQLHLWAAPRVSGDIQVNPIYCEENSSKVFNSTNNSLEFIENTDLYYKLEDAYGNMSSLYHIYLNDISTLESSGTEITESFEDFN